MCDKAKPQDDAAMSPASTGSVVAWAIVCGDCVDSTFCDRDEAVQWACGLIPPAQIVPLYRQPQPTLTHAERNDLAIAADAYADNDDDPDCERIAATLRGLLERLK